MKPASFGEGFASSEATRVWGRHSIRATGHENSTYRGESIKHVLIGQPQRDPKDTHSSVDEISRDSTLAKAWGNSRLVRGLERRDNVSSEGKVVGSSESPTRAVYSFEARFRCRRDRFPELRKGVQRLLEASDSEIRLDCWTRDSI